MWYEHCFSTAVSILTVSQVIKITMTFVCRWMIFGVCTNGDDVQSWSGNLLYTTFSKSVWLFDVIRIVAFLLWSL